MPFRTRTGFLVAFIVSMPACGGDSVTGGTRQPFTDAGASTGGACATHPGSPPTGRPAPVSCTPSPHSLAAADSGPSACASADDCGPGTVCFHGSCSFDACLADGDCASGSVCVCADTFYGGNGVHGNRCVTANCQTDADCGPAGVCSVSSGYCGAPLGYFCHSAADACQTNADCCVDTPSCRYESTVGHWTCQNSAVCSG